MVHPLVHNVERTLHLMQVGYGILRQYSDIVGSDHLRQAVVDFRIHVVRASCQYDTAVSCLV